jgi:hypothetical protein
VLGPLIAATLLAAGTELVLLRLISRIGVHIPALPWLRGMYEAAVTVGTVAFPVATVFAAALLAALALRLAGRAWVAALAVITVLGFQVWLLAAPAGAAGAALHAFLLAGALQAIVLAAALSGRGRGPLIFLGLVAGGQALAAVQTGSAQLATLGGQALPLEIAVLGEPLLLAALLAAPVLLAPPRWQRAAVIGGGVATLVAAGMMLGNGSTARILALWTLGLQMPVPWALYTLATGTLAATAIANWRADRMAMAAGLQLLALGGFAPPSSYQADLMLAGLVLLAFPQISAACPAPRAHLSAATIAGKPVVVPLNRRACAISRREMPAARALRTCERTPPSAAAPTAMPSLTRRRVCWSSGPASCSVPDN